MILTFGSISFDFTSLCSKSSVIIICLGSLKYSQKFDELIRLGKEMALAQGGARKSKMKIAVFKDKAENMTEHRCDVDLEFGPWQGDPNVPDLTRFYHPKFLWKKFA